MYRHCVSPLQANKYAVLCPGGGAALYHHPKYSTIPTKNKSPRYDSVPVDAPKWAKFPDGSRFWKNNHGRLQRPIFVAATRQHVGVSTIILLTVIFLLVVFGEEYCMVYGRSDNCQKEYLNLLKHTCLPLLVVSTYQKTTCSLAIMSGLQKRFKNVGFLKPVGQQHVEVHSDNQNQVIRVDKDVCLVREHFHLDHIDYEDMSPVIIPAGYTKDFVDGKITLESQIRDVEIAMDHVTKASEIVLAEGTGHCGVGSIVGLNNAKIASLIGADMVLVCNGGLGSAFDELELNRILCQHYNVRVAGVIINKVIPEKLEQTAHYMRKAMMQAWGIPLLACVPDRNFLGCPALADLENLFKTQLISGSEHCFRHYDVNHINVVTTSLTRFLENLRLKKPRTLYICHVTRDDLIVGFMGEYVIVCYGIECNP